MSIDRGAAQEDVVHIHNGILLSHEKERNNSICSNLGGPRNDHAKQSQSDSETPTSSAFTDMWNLKKGQTELPCRTDADSQMLKNLWSPENRFEVWGDVLGLCDRNPVNSDCYDHYTTTDVINSYD